MSARYVPQKVASSYYVMDTDAHCLLPDRYLSWSQALTAAGLLNTPEPKPAAPCCACAARVERHERALFFLLEVLAQWSPTIGFSYQAEFMGRIIEKTRQIMKGGE